MANDNLENTLIKQFGNGILPIQSEDFDEIKAAIKKDEEEQPKPDIKWAGILTTTYTK